MNEPECVEWKREAMKQRLSVKNLPKIQATRFKKLQLEKERATPMRGRRLKKRSRRKTVA